MKTIILLIALITCTACTCEDSARSTLRAYGFTDIHFTGYSFFACGKDDFTATGFKAKNQQGQIVEGTVCCGVLKSCTVRF